MLWIFHDGFAWAFLHNFATPHDRDAMANVVHDGHIVAYEEVGEAKLILQILKQVEDL